MKKSRPQLYTDMKDLIDPDKKIIAENGFDSAFAEREFFASLKFNLPAAQCQIDNLISTIRESIEQINMVQTHLISLPTILKIIQMLNASNTSQGVIVCTQDLMKRLGIRNWKPPGQSQARISPQRQPVHSRNPNVNAMLNLDDQANVLTQQE
jgi:hypothetical protein